MLRIQILFILLSLSALNLFACASDLQSPASNGPELRSLYTVSWGTDHQTISVLQSRGTSEAGVCDDSICKNGQINGRALVCPDRLVQLQTGAEGYFSYDLRRPRSAALGEFDRLAYVLDKNGDLHVTDTGWTAAVSDDLPLLLWTAGKNNIEILAGNAKKQLAGIDLQGELKLWAVNDQDLFVLYQHRQDAQWSWGIEKISLVDFRVEAARPEQTVDSESEIPQQLRVTEEGHLKVYRDGLLLTELPL
jgi:hypothetical protein